MWSDRAKIGCYRSCPTWILKVSPSTGLRRNLVGPSDGSDVATDRFVSSRRCGGRNKDAMRYSEIVVLVELPQTPFCPHRQDGIDRIAISMPWRHEMLLSQAISCRRWISDGSRNCLDQSDDRVRKPRAQRWMSQRPPLMAQRPQLTARKDESLGSFGRSPKE